MKCELCKKKDPKTMYILPLHQKDGKLDTMACEGCAKKSTAYCLKHDRIHQGYMDGTTACLSCVNELVQSEREIYGEWQIFQDIMVALDKNDAAQLDELADISASIVGDDRAMALLRFLASKACRNGLKVEEVTRRVINSRSIAFLLG